MLKETDTRSVERKESGTLIAFQTELLKEAERVRDDDCETIELNDQFY